jgi:DNA-binding transcriptional LysR family regulator
MRAKNRGMGAKIISREVQKPGDEVLSDFAQVSSRLHASPSTIPMRNRLDAFAASRLEFRHLRYFLAVAEEEHFGRGAKKVCVAQPAISRQIQQLEQELGVQLFRRSHNRVRLTEVGRYFMEKARVIINSMTLAVEETRHVNRAQNARIRVGYVDIAFYSGALPEKIRCFQEHNPGLKVELIPGTSVEQTALLESGDIDVGLIYQEPIGSSRLDSRKLSTEPLVVAVHQDNKFARRSCVSLSELSGEPFVWFDRIQNPTLFDHVDEVCRRCGLRRRIVQDGANDLAQLALVASRVGVTLSPLSAIQTKPANVRLIRLQGRPLNISLYVAWRKDAVTPRATRGLVSALDEVNAGLVNHCD